MADVLILGMEMPRRREEVFLFAVDSDGKVYGWDSEELPRLKAIAIPDHGRLIDADALKKKHHWTDDFYETEYVEVEDIDAAPTIIPASDTESEVDRDS